ncbi:MAG TPA: ribosomal protein S18-alanine N-acetyltransferase [Gemmatimonadaceae bacterium]|nr:ribosomal protein S18-alanine N-acetyltransferase [Gemmatimonadaceae bacterium]
MTGSGLVLRPAGVADLPEVAAIELACFRDPWPQQSFEAFVGRPGATFIVAEGRKGGVAGYAVLLRAADEAEVLNLAVPEDARRRGVGRALLDRLLHEARADGARTIYLEVRESNAAARGLYQSHGFVEVGRRRRYYQRPVEDALILQRVEP